MSQSNVELARSGYQAVLRGDLSIIGDLLAPDVMWHGGDPTEPDACRNRAEALAVMREAFAHGGVGELADVVGAGDKVVVIMRSQSGDGEVDALVAVVTTFREGKVVEMVHYPDPEDALASVRP